MQTTSARLQAPDHRSGPLTPDGRPIADGKEQDVDRADRLALLGTERALAEVAEVRDPQVVEREHDDRVRPALRARGLVVLGGDRHDLAERRFERARRRANQVRVAADDLYRIVVEVLVRHQEELGRGVRDRRVVEAEVGHPLAPERQHLFGDLAERVDEDPRAVARMSAGTHSVRTSGSA